MDQTAAIRGKTGTGSRDPPLGPNALQIQLIFFEGPLREDRSDLAPLLSSITEFCRPSTKVKTHRYALWDPLSLVNSFGQGVRRDCGCPIIVYPISFFMGFFFPHVGRSSCKGFFFFGIFLEGWTVQGIVSVFNVHSLNETEKCLLFEPLIPFFSVDIVKRSRTCDPSASMPNTKNLDR